MAQRAAVITQRIGLLQEDTNCIVMIKHAVSFRMHVFLSLSFNWVCVRACTRVGGWVGAGY